VTDQDILDFAGRVAVITGAGSPTGIGFATADLLGKLGAAVAIGGTTPRIEARVKDLQAAGVDAIGFCGDLTVPASATALASSAMSRWGRIDVLVNNAGMVSAAQPEFESGGVRDMTLPMWRQGMARNLETAFLMTAAVEPFMQERNYGRILMVASITGPVMAMRSDIVYAAAKAGLTGLVRALAVDLAGSGITVNAVAPGWISTGSQTIDERREGVHTPIGRSGTPEEVASAIVWLTSSSASYVTGQCLNIDGGNSIAEQRAVPGSR
jgi:3-oxoacyl-[acyl-carrier protein] reductase